MPPRFRLYPYFDRIATFPPVLELDRSARTRVRRREYCTEPCKRVPVQSLPRAGALMLKPSLQIHDVSGLLVGEFWDCLRLDPAPVQELRTAYEKHIDRRGKPHLLVDLSGVGFAGSAALGNFVALHRLVRQNGGRTAFCNVDPTVAEVFRASKLESLFEFFADRDTAIKAISDGTPPAPVERKPGTAPTERLPPPLRSGLLRGRRRGNDEPQSS